jgi:hypothetical protein
VDGGIILEGISEKQDGWLWIGLIWLRTETMAGCCEHGDEGSGCVKCGEFVDQLRNN